jgi:hypothetical protein
LAQALAFGEKSIINVLIQMIIREGGDDLVTCWVMRTYLLETLSLTESIGKLGSVYK